MADILKEAPLTSVQVEALVSIARRAIIARDPKAISGGDENNKTLLAELPIDNHRVPVDPPPTDTYHDSNNISQLAAAAPRIKANGIYQNEMIKKLREVNVDANNVGWYTSANLGNFVNMNMIENQFHYQKELNERTVALVHDVSRSSQGSLSLRAFRLSPAFMLAYKENKFTVE
ncbi:MAG: hypothetical protein Q9205_002377, partial [Flavoplaca limonia]